MAASSYGNFKRTSVTHLEKGVLFLSHCYPERIIHDDACHLKKGCVNPVRKEVTAVFKRLGKMDMVVDKLQFRNHVDLWCEPNCNPYDRNELHGVSVCPSVCPSVYRHHLAFLGGGIGGLTSDFEENR